MTNRSTIYIPEEIRDLLGPVQDRGLSQRIAGIITDWHRVITDAMPELTQSEWLYLMDMLNGTVLEGRHVQFLGSDVAESGKEDGLGEKWGIDPMDFGRKIDTLPVAAKLAIHDVAYRFWQRHGIVSDWREVLDKCGAKVK